MKEASMFSHRTFAHPQMIQHFILYFKNKLLNSNKSVPFQIICDCAGARPTFTDIESSYRQWEKKFSRVKALHECFIKITLFLRAKICFYRNLACHQKNQLTTKQNKM